MNELISSLIRKGVKYHEERANWEVPKPTSILASIDDRCEAQCKTCDLWKSPNPRHMNNEELGQILESPLWSELRAISITGGEITLRDDLSSLPLETGLVNLPRLSAVGIPTNGSAPEKMLSDVKHWLECFKPRKIWLCISISADGFGERNEELRGIPWSSIEKTVKLLSSLTRKEMLSISIRSTFHNDNFNDVLEIAKWCSRNGVSHSVGTFISSKERYAHSSPRSDAEEPEYWVKTRNTLEELMWIQDTFLNLENVYMLKQIRNRGIREAPCLAGWRAAYLSPDGELRPCYLEDSMGNILREDPLTVWRGTKAEEIRQRLIYEPKCRICRNMWPMPVSLANEGFTYAKLLTESPLLYPPYRTSPWINYAVKTGLSPYLEGSDRFDIADELERTHRHEYYKYYELKKGDVFLQAGAYLGYELNNVLPSIGEEGQAILIEPDPRSFAIMNKIWGEQENVTLIQKGLWKSSGKGHLITYDVPAISHIHKSNLDIRDKTGAKEVSIELVSLDDLVIELGIETINLFTADVEGSEVFVLAGASRMLSSKAIRNIAITVYHDHPDGNKKQARSILSAYGYNLLADHKGVLYSRA